MALSPYHGFRTPATASRPPRNVRSTLTLLAVVLGTILYFSVSTNGRPDPEEASGLRREASRGKSVKRTPAEEVELGVFRVDLNRPSDPRFDPERGWMLDPVEASALFSVTGGATACSHLHVGIVMPGKMRGNHRHHYGNETMVLWGGKTLLRLEDPTVQGGFAEFVMERNEVIIAAGRKSMAHAITNLDDAMYTNIAACMDAEFDKENPRSDYKVWNDL